MTGVLTPAISIPVAAMLVLLLRYVKVKDAYEAVDWQAVVTVAGMIPFGLALEKTGAAAETRARHGRGCWRTSARWS